MNSKKLLILGGANVHVKVVKAAKEMGLYTIVTDYLENSPAKLIADKSYMLDVKDVDGIVKMCRQEKVDGVIGPYLDPCQRPYYEICHRLHLPWYIDTWEQVYTLTDKNAFKACCVQNGVDIIPTYSIDSPQEIEYPVFVKPCECRGSRGQTICNSFEEVKKAYEVACEISENKKAVIEKFMENASDFTMTYVFAEGEAHLVRVGDMHFKLKKYYSEGVISPSCHADIYLKNAEEHVLHMLKSLGIKNGPVFMQGFVDGETVRFYDPGYRFPGSEYDSMLKKVCGVDNVKMMIEFALTGCMKNAYWNIHKDCAFLNGKIVVVFYPNLRDGTIREIRGLEHIEKMEEVIHYTLRHNIGDSVRATGDVNQYLGEFNIVAQSREAAAYTANQILNALQVMDDNGRDMVVRPPDGEKYFNNWFYAYEK